MTTNPASLLHIDSDQGGFERWAFFHARDHDTLINAATARGAVGLQFYILDPVAGEFDAWLFDHQKAHDDLGRVTGVANADLQTVDWSDPQQRSAWIDLNAQEHAVFAAALGA